MTKFRKRKIAIVWLAIVISLCGVLLIKNESYGADSKKSLEEGIYIIKSAIDEKHVLDVKGASMSDSANIQVWSYANVDQQRFRLNYLGDGYYTITSVKSKKVIDVAGGGKTSGTNVQQYGSNGTDAQKWLIQDAGDGYFYIISKLNGLYLDVAGGSANNGTNVQVYTGNKTKAQKFKFEKYGITGTKTIDDGTYVIQSAINNKYVLDICAASKLDSANVQLYSDANVPQQRFNVKYLDNGFYVITSVHSGKAIDVAGGGKTPGTNIQQYTSNGTDAQRWIIQDAGDGYYYIISKLNGLYMDVSGGSATNRNNIQVYSGNKTAAQKFKFDKYEEKKPEEKPSNNDTTKTDNDTTKPTTSLGTTATGTKTIDDGIYILKSGLNENYALDISGASKENKANVQIWTDASVTQQRYRIKYLNDGYYSITNVHSNKALETVDSAYKAGTNVQQNAPSNSDTQKWVIKDAGNGYYYIISKPTGLCMDVWGGYAHDGTNVEVYVPNQTNAQKFKFELTGEKTIDVGRYTIRTKLNENYVLDISAASKDSGANVQLWSYANVNQQTFRLSYNERGYYTITAVHSNKVLDVKSGSKLSGANVQQYVSNNTEAQRWIIESDGNSGYLIKSKLSGKYLNIQDQKAVNGQNVNVEDKNNTKSQMFILESTSNVIELDTKKYPGYKEKIDALMKKYSNWDFEILYTGLTFNEVVQGEHALRSRNLVPDTFSGEWIDGTEPYDTGRWYAASTKAISYYMDPRNFLNDIDVFQFLDVNQFSKDSCTTSGIQNRVSGTYLCPYANDIIKACTNENVDPYYVIARLIQEQGSSGIGAWKMSSGGKTYFNPFNIGASGSGSEVYNNSLKTAKNNGWDTMQKAIQGGIYFLKQNYLDNYQNTLYTNKFDIDVRSGNNAGKSGLYNHQYMQNLLAAYNEARTLRGCYNSDGKLNSQFTFIVPVYEGMSGSTSTTPSSNSESYPMNVKTTGTNVYIRKSADTSSEIITTISAKGTVLLSVKRGVNSNWQQVVTSDGKIGYMYGNYLTQIDDVKTCNYKAAIKTNDGDGCSVRIGPSTSLDRINAFSDGTLVTVIDDSTYKNINGYDWYRIILPSGDQGFMPGKYLAKQ